MTRQFQARTEALAVRDGEGWILKSPGPGLFFPVEGLTLVTPGSVIGDLEVLGKKTQLRAPDVTGLATGFALDARKVSYGDTLVVLGAAAAAADRAAAATAAQGASATTGLVFKAPTSGRFYSRATPDKPPFVAVGDTLSAGSTVCLLEVMKTFNRVTYGGPSLPERAIVKAILIADGADVTAGDALLALEPA